MSKVHKEIDRELRRYNFILGAVKCLLRALRQTAPICRETWLQVGELCLKAAEEVQSG